MLRVLPLRKGSGFIGLLFSFIRCYLLAARRCVREQFSSWGEGSPCPALPKRSRRRWALKRRWRCQWPRYQQMVLKNTKCSPKVLRALELLRFCVPNGCYSLSSFAILQRSADADWAILEALCIILHQGFKKKNVWVRQRSKSEG